MNFRIRLKNPVFIFEILMSIFVPLVAYLGLNLSDLTSWAIVGDVLLEGIRNPYVLALVAISVFNASTDPTTKGIADSERAKAYKDLG